MLIFLPNGVRIIQSKLEIYKPYGERGIMFSVGDQVETYIFRDMTNRTIALIKLDENLGGFEHIHLEDYE